MSGKMKAAVVKEFGKPLSIESVDIPSPGPSQILIKVISSGVCHTDLHAAEGDWPVKPRLPLIPGHEKGDTVGIPWLFHACGRCEYCIDGIETLCPSQLDTGYFVNGGYAEYAVAEANYVARVPEGVDIYGIAPIFCAGVTVYKGLKETQVKPGQWIVISGVGGLGHVAIQYAKAMGMHVAVVDIADEKLELAGKLGAEVKVNASKQDPVEAIQRSTGGAHGVLIAAASMKAYEQAIGMIRRRGVIVCNGLPPGTFPLSVFEVVLKGATVKGSIVGTRKDLQEAIAFAAEGKVKSK
ncbi:Alcohol dehydrogenase [Galdieria sulphuraria]|nr:Alcohol dehydrogenase [Galdieria sulphuraria]